MADSIPSQIRTVDPFSSYGSNVVNRHTKMVTFDEEGMANINSLRVTDAMDATSTAVVVSTGFAYKDEVLLHMDGTAIVDFNTADHYYDWDSPGLGFNENGYYYIVLNYVYVKSRPAPVVSYQILKPSQRGAFSTGGSWLFLAAVLISGVGGAGAQIDAILDYDPEPPYQDNKRLYVKSYMGTDTLLPDHNQTRDQSRVAYDSQVDEFYFGYSDRWRSLGKGTGTVGEDTSGVAVGDLVYVDASGNVQKAILSDEILSADGVVIVSDTETGSPPGTIQTIGLVEDVPVEAARVGSVEVGDLLYLSDTEAGKVTDVETIPQVQFVGRCLGVSGSTIDMLFVRGAVIETSAGSSIVEDTSGVSVGDLVYVDASGNVQKAILSDEILSADGVVTISGTAISSPPGIIQLIGLVEDVPVEAARVGSVAVGDLLFLSDTEAGKVTDTETIPQVQFVGRCLAVDGATVDMLFVRGPVIETSAGSSIIKDTSALSVGDLVYTDGSGNIQKAILSSEALSADGVVTISGTAISSPPGIIQLIGFVEDVPIEAGRVGSVAVGELLYLSGSEAGKITDVKTTPIVQFVGRCLAVDGATVDMLFVRGDVVETNTAISVSTTLSAWTLDGGSYRADVDISEISLQYNTIIVVDDADDMKIEPQDIEFVSTSITRIWMPDNTHTLHVTVVG